MSEEHRSKERPFIGVTGLPERESNCEATFAGARKEENMAKEKGSTDRSVPAVETHLRVNGQERTLMVEPWTSLLDLLRESLQLTGSKKGCDHGQCGACTILLDGVRVNSACASPSCTMA